MTFEQALPWPIPERVGPYRLGELLGQGGMGRVYRAERVDGVFEQTVAVKLMGRSSLSTLHHEQFARERQTLARLQHRNIAQLFDGGITPEGHSYIAMELVSGRPITQYAREEALSVRPTLLLFRQVCAAVQYAHSHLVVHADIKPNNIRVTADGTVKLLDFGVASVMGTPTTTADDVRSLGELLDALLRHLPRIAPDLRAIVERARSADSNGRYVAVDEMQADIEHWLDDLPVLAHGTSWRYIARKFIARHRLAVAAGVGGALLLIGSAIGFATLYVRAEHAKARADQRFGDVRSLSHYVLFDVYDRLETIPRALTLRRDIAVAGQRYLDRLSHDPDAPVEVRMEVIEGLRRLAQVQATPGSASLAEAPQARANLDHAEALASALSDDAPSRRSRALIRARIALARSVLASEKELDFARSRKALDEARLLLAAVLKENPRDVEAQGLQLDLDVQDAGTLEWQGSYAQAIQVARNALARPSLREPNTADAAGRALTLKRVRLLDILAEALYYSGDPPAAEQPYRQQYDLLRALSAAEPNNLAFSRRVVRAAWALSMTYIENGRPSETDSILANAVKLGERLQLLEPDDRDLARIVEITQRAQAQAFVGERRFAAAEPILQRSINVRQALWQHSPQDWTLARDYAISLQTLADMWADAGDTKRACQTYKTSLDTFAQIRAAGRLPKLDEDYTLREIGERVARHCSPRQVD